MLKLIFYSISSNMVFLLGPNDNPFWEMISANDKTILWVVTLGEKE